MKRLFREEFETYNDEASEIYMKINEAIHEFFRTYCKEQEYSTRDLELIIHDIVSITSAEFRLERNVKLMKEKRNEKIQNKML